MNDKKEEKQTKVSIRSGFPKDNFEKALGVAQAIENANGGNPLPPQDVAIALNRSPGSSIFRILLSSSIKYGLTTGSFNSERISLTDLGRDIVEPKDEQSKKAAVVSAIFKPELFSNIFEYYKNKKVPIKSFFENTLSRDFGIPKKQTGVFFEVFMDNLKHLNLIKKIKGDSWFASTRHSSSLLPEPEIEENKVNIEEATDGESELNKTQEIKTDYQKTPKTVDERRVFIAHGKNTNFIETIKKIIKLGDLEPIISTEKPSVSQPIPYKVMNDMRSCGSAILHVDSELTLTDEDGKEKIILNPNVLIEIGAAMALYDRRFVLLVKEGIKLPSNLQGLSEVRYSGDKLEADKALELLESIKDISNHKLPSDSK